jgi:hypothetical protein
VCFRKSLVDFGGDGNFNSCDIELFPEVPNAIGFGFRLLCDYVARLEVEEF